VFSSVAAVLEKHESALLMLLGFGGFSILLAMLHNAVRKYIFHDTHNLDTTFDAGGNVSLSLTAVTVASQLFWPGDILHSATLTTKVCLALRTSQSLSLNARLHQGRSLSPQRIVLITHTVYMSVHIFNTRYVHLVPAYTGTHFQLGGLKP
jgi:hypothetical protein